MGVAQDLRRSYADGTVLAAEGKGMQTRGNLGLIYRQRRGRSAGLYEALRW